MSNLSLTLCQVTVKEIKNKFVTIICHNDELSWLFKKDLELFILFAENSQIFLKISVIPILLTLIYLVALYLLVNNQLNSSLWHIIVTNISRNLTD